MTDNPELKAVKKLSWYMSAWLYSVGPPPAPANKLFIDWVEGRGVPSVEQVNAAIRESELILRKSRQRDSSL